MTGLTSFPSVHKVDYPHSNPLLDFSKRYEETAAAPPKVNERLKIRSFLCVPRRLLSQKTITECKADVTLLDMEDSIPENERPSARAFYRNFLNSLEKQKKLSIYVRINPVMAHSDNWQLDLQALTHPLVDGFHVAKTESPVDIYRCSEMLSEMEAERGLPQGFFKLGPVLETPSGVLSAAEILRSNPRVDHVSVGNHDLAAELQCDVDSPVMYPCYRKVITAARSTGIRPVYGVFKSLDSHARHAKETERLVNMGFVGKYQSSFPGLFYQQLTRN